MNDLFFIEPATGSRVLYSELWNAWSRPEVEVPTFLQGAGAREVAVAVARALVLGHPLALPPSGTADESARPALLTIPGLRHSSLAEALAAARRASDGFRLTLFTSGSTGLPKAVTHTLDTLGRSLRIGGGHASSVWGLAYDPTHIAGVQVILQALFNQNPLVHIGGLDPAACCASLRAEGVTHLSATPSFYRMLLAPGETLQGIRALALGGERADPGLIERLGAMFPNAKIRNLYGSTEAGTILEANGELFGIPQGLGGRVRITGDQLEIHASLLGEFSSDTITGPAPEPRTDAWYATGDMVTIVSESPLRFRIVSRERDWVNVGGEKVNPGEVEDLLLACPGVREASVYGRANSVLGSILCAEVVAERAFSEEAARGWLAERLPPAKIPRLIKIVPALPRTRTGKLVRPSTM